MNFLTDLLGGVLSAGRDGSPPVYEDWGGKQIQVGGVVDRAKTWELMETSFERYVARETPAQVRAFAGLGPRDGVDDGDAAAGSTAGAHLEVAAPGMTIDRGGGGGNSSNEPLLPGRGRAPSGSKDDNYEDWVTLYQRSVIFEESCGVSGTLGLAVLRAAMTTFKDDRALHALLYGTAAAESLLVKRLADDGFASELKALTVKQTDMMTEAQAIADPQSRQAFINERMEHMSDREREIGGEMSTLMQTAMFLNQMRQQRGVPLIQLTAFQ